MKELDLRNLDCTEPVSRTKDEIARTKVGESFMVILNNLAASKNVSRLASSENCEVASYLDGNDFKLTITKIAETNKETLPADTACDSSTVLFIKNEFLGKGDDGLGRVLVNAFFNTLAQYENPPKKIFFVNSGIKLTTRGADTLQALNTLSQKGTKIYSCGTCLDFYELKDVLAVGEVGNMHDLVDNLLTHTVVYI